MEINVALDELLGLRGPLSTLVRNLLWLLAFNATYLGIFAFLPKTVGAAVYTGILNTTTCDTILKLVPFMYSEDEEKLTVISIVKSLNEESSRQNTTFKLPDVATVTLGYFSMAFIIVLMRYGWVFVQKLRQRLSIETTDTNNEQDVQEIRLQHMRLQQDRAADRNAFDDPDGMDAQSETTAVGAALDATVAVVKVGVLLFLKMFLLPLILGLWLDASTTELFGHTASDRIAFAGGDLFSFVLLHWVAGITFMLLVTVFLLQLREVAHPELLARMIRPQEPQPDLLGNLMHETVTTHMKRMFLSLGIYAPLLTMHVTLPVKLFMYSGLGSRVTFFHLNFWHLLMPKMQIPLELIIFHLSMLALLERYKNSIGGLQHRWMVFMCRRMGLTEHIMPRSVAKFELYGTKEILSVSGAVDSFWYDLAGATIDINQLVLSNIERTEEKRIDEGKSKENGQRVLTLSFDFVRLPPSPNVDDVKHLLPTKRGQFQLKVAEASSSASAQTIEFWREIPGEETPRPPEGWDDLGVGGAYVQGRWAWATERKSTVEWSVAQRTPFKASEKQRRPVLLMLKVVALLVLSWFAITLTVFFMFSVPLAVGRSLYHLFRVPPHYIHDPLAFSIGGCLVFPMISLLYRRFGDEQDSPLRHILAFFSRLHPPPRQKLLVAIESLVLWMVVAPLALGVSYEIAVVKTRAWFAREEPLADMKSVLFCWLVGTVVLHTWAFLAYFNVFTKTFWANIGNGILEPPVDDNGIVGAGRNNIDERNIADNDGEVELDGLPSHPWQGKRGRVDRFFNIWIAILTGWDWEAVDRTCLLQEFARPITKQVASALVGSSLSYQFALFAVPIFAKFVEGGVAGKFFLG
jgi:E3 ubiquitin-protein ligase MARCH6